MAAVCAICVTYNPGLDGLHGVLESVLGQVDRVYLIDNGSAEPVGAAGAALDGVEVVPLPENRGVAAALNVGIDLARAAGFRYVLLLDQDSRPPAGMVQRYLGVMKDLADASALVAALGPRYRNPVSGHCSRFVHFNWFRNSYHGSDDEPPLVETDFLITSGSFCDIRVFERVGLFNEGLFIDHVDTEWCHRAKSLGYRFLGVWDLVLEHSLGESGLRLWFLRWRVQPIHKPFRLFYIFRNSVLLYRMSHTPLKWISSDILRLLRLLVIYLIFSKQRIESTRKALSGLFDGLRGVTGPIKKNESLW